ncbi:MAG: ABC transporter permease subunit [Actinomycetota bacterium]|nr:ABC transporter permease subunit [Actinomycetota bacterium]
MTGEATALRRVETAHSLRGLAGMLVVELRAWFPWRVLFLTITGFGVFAMIYFPVRFADDNQFGQMLYPFLGFWIAMLLISVVSLTEGSVLGEIERGTASWLVGLPIGRPTVIVAKFLAASSGVAVTVFVTGTALYPVLLDVSGWGKTEVRVSEIMEVTGGPIGMWGRFTSLVGFGEWIGLLLALSVFLMFVVAVMMLLGTVLRSRTAVFGLGLAVVGVFGAIALAGSYSAASPAGLIRVIIDVAQGKNPSVTIPLAASLLWTALVLALAVWRFDRKELS